MKINIYCIQKFMTPSIITYHRTVSAFEPRLRPCASTTNRRKTSQLVIPDRKSVV